MVDGDGRRSNGGSVRTVPFVIKRVVPNTNGKKEGTVVVRWRCSSRHIHVSKKRHGEKERKGKRKIKSKVRWRK